MRGDAKELIRRIESLPLSDELQKAESWTTRGAFPFRRGRLPGHANHLVRGRSMVFYAPMIRSPCFFRPPG